MRIMKCAHFQWRFYLERDIFKLRYVHLQACYSEQVFKLVQIEQRKTGQIRIQGGMLSQPGCIDDRREQDDGSSSSHSYDAIQGWYLYFPFPFYFPLLLSFTLPHLLPRLEVFLSSYFLLSLPFLYFNILLLLSHLFCQFCLYMYSSLLSLRKLRQGPPLPTSTLPERERERRGRPRNGHDVQFSS